MFCEWCGTGVQFHFSARGIQLSQHHLLKRLSQEPYVLKAPQVSLTRATASALRCQLQRDGSCMGDPCSPGPDAPWGRGSGLSHRLVKGSPCRGPAATTISASQWPCQSPHLQMPELKLKGAWEVGTAPSPVVGVLWAAAGLFADPQTPQMGPGGGAGDDRGNTERSLYQVCIHSVIRQ